MLFIELYYVIKRTKIFENGSKFEATMVSLKKQSIVVRGVAYNINDKTNLFFQKLSLFSPHTHTHLSVWTHHKLINCEKIQCFCTKN